jgi:gamma-glutamylaminecyclotransferase
MHRLSVFGTIKKGFPLHEKVVGDSGLVGAYKTLKRYPMLVAGPWFAPMMLPCPAGRAL